MQPQNSEQAGDDERCCPVEQEACNHLLFLSEQGEGKTGLERGSLGRSPLYPRSCGVHAIYLRERSTARAKLKLRQALRD
mmetsp:Transcript_22904/g.49923  ORF Transcript_22904/g.49923 Transcript_22904/m.49923 type:complete len:80 (+) Transcript_22904:35-274(+)